jgi:hypothetical protein
VIYPGDTKVGVLEEPFLTSYTYLRHCLEAAKNVVVIGYSFRDQILQTLFQQARLANPGVRFIVINGPSPNESLLRKSLGGDALLISAWFEGGDGADYLKQVRSILLPQPTASLRWLGKTGDFVGPADGAFQPDGSPDAVFKLSVNSEVKESVERLDLFRQDDQGNDTGERWTSRSGEGTWALGVFPGNSPAQLPLSVSPRKVLEVSIAASDDPSGETWFGPGSKYRLVIHFKKGPQLIVSAEVPQENPVGHA